MTQTVLLIDDNPRKFAPLAEHLQSIGYRMKVGDAKMRADEQVIRARAHVVLLSKRNKSAQEQIQANVRVADVPIVTVKSSRWSIEKNVEAIKVALLEASMRRLR